jgi:hypothetical protein
MELLFAAALALITLLGWRWSNRAGGADDAWAPLARLVPLVTILLWAYVATAVASAGTWPLGMPGASEQVLGGVLAAAGLAGLAVAVAAPRLRDPRLDPVTEHPMASVAVLLGGIALLGDSGFGLVLAGLFAGLAVLAGPRAGVLRV